MKKHLLLLFFILILTSCTKKDFVYTKKNVNSLYWGCVDNVLYITTYKTDVATNYYELPTLDDIAIDPYVDVGWHSSREFNVNVCIKVIIDCRDDEVISPVTMYRWFGSFRSCEEIIGLDNIDTSNVVDMGLLFCECQELKELDLSTFDTRNVTNMLLMFDTCSSLEYLDISSFDTSSVVHIQSMFGNPNDYIKGISINHFDLSNAIDIRDINDLFGYHLV